MSLRMFPQLKPPIIADKTVMPDLEQPHSRDESFRSHLASAGDSSPQRSEHDADWQQLHQIEIEIPERLRRIGKILERMDIVEDEVLRVTPARRCFEQRAIAFHGSEVNQDLYEKSRKSRKVDTFWSHSSEGARWKKILTLMAEYNGKTAVFYGMLMALVLIVFWWWIQVVAVSAKVKQLYWSRSLTHTSFVRWSVCLVYLVAGLVIFFLRPETRVFLEQICIKQQDNAMKVNTIFSLAGIIKKSDSMLILWDPTWTESLWCLVELAAFLKSRQNPEEQLIIRPSFLGSASMVVSLTALAAFLTLLPPESSPSQRTILLPPLPGLTQPFPFLVCSLVAAYAGVRALRSYFRSVENMQQRLLSISFDDTRCSCCDRNHVSPTGKPMVCDRKVFAQCIIHWFDGRDAFEDILRSEVARRMVIELRDRVFSTHWVLAATMPLMLGYLVLAACEAISVSTYTARGTRTWDDAQSHLLDGFGIWLLFPQFVHLVTCVCKHTQARPDSHCLEFAKNAAIVVALGMPIFGVMACVVLINDHPALKTNAERSMAFLGCLLICAAFIGCLTCRARQIEEPARSFVL